MLGAGQGGFRAPLVGQDGSNNSAHSHIHKTAQCKELRPVCQSQEGELCALSKWDLIA